MAYRHRTKLTTKQWTTYSQEITSGIVFNWMFPLIVRWSHFECNVYVEIIVFDALPSTKPPVSYKRTCKTDVGSESRTLV